MIEELLKRVVELRSAEMPIKQLNQDLWYCVINELAINLQQGKNSSIQTIEDAASRLRLKVQKGGSIFLTRRSLRPRIGYDIPERLWPLNQFSVEFESSYSLQLKKKLEEIKQKHLPNFYGDLLTSLAPENPKCVYLCPSRLPFNEVDYRNFSLKNHWDIVDRDDSLGKSEDISGIEIFNENFGSWKMNVFDISLYTKAKSPLKKEEYDVCVLYADHAGENVTWQFAKDLLKPGGILVTQDCYFLESKFFAEFSPILSDPPNCLVDSIYTKK